MYPIYSLEVYDHVQRRWVPNATYPAGNKPHHYDYLRQGFDRMVAGAMHASANQAPTGYRIMKNTTTVIDSWDNGKAN